MNNRKRLTTNLSILLIFISLIFIISLSQNTLAGIGTYPYCICGYCDLDGCYIKLACPIESGEYPDAGNVCDDILDNDCDGFVDEADVDCPFTLQFFPNPVMPSQTVTAKVTPNFVLSDFPHTYGPIRIQPGTTDSLSMTECTISTAEQPHPPPYFYNCTFTAPSTPGNYPYYAGIGVWANASNPLGQNEYSLVGGNSANATLYVQSTTPPSTGCIYDGITFAIGSQILADCNQLGACEGATRTCLSDGNWSDCSKLPTNEVCNDNIDNDCDGKVDCLDNDCGNISYCQNIIYCVFNEQNYLPGTQITGDCNQLGACEEATRTCLSDGNWSDCSKLPTNEVCNDNIDNDCDGFINNNCTGECSSVSGYVYDAEKGTGIQGAVVSITSPITLSNTTNPFGIYNLFVNNFSGGKISMKASANDYDSHIDTLNIVCGNNYNKDFYLINGTCHSDCTDYLGKCNYDCIGLGKCELCSSLSETQKNRIKEVCSSARKGEWRVYNESHYVVCCGSSEDSCPPFVERHLIEGEIESCASSLVKSSRIAFYEGRPVVIEIYVWKKCK